MAAAAVQHVYDYPFASELVPAPEGSRLRLATSTRPGEHPHFFKGRLTHPQRAAELLLALSEISRTRFFLPPGMLARIIAAADPVVTSGGERLRFEAFSVCCGVYARVDLLPEAVEGDWTGRGTTNVDFNPPMRAMLGRIGASDGVSLSVGATSLELEREGKSVVERKVKLPMRWLKGFVEVQSYQSRMQPALELSADEASRFFRGLPRTVAGGAPGYAVPAGKGLRLSQRDAPGAIRLGGSGRLKLLERLARHARRVRVYSGADGVSGWELVLDEARLHLVLSPDPSRGFSGEGQALSHLARSDSRDALGYVRAALRWQATLDPGALGRDLGLEPQAVWQSLSVLGSRGLVGYDLESASFFHRELPFDLDLVEQLQPRLRDARELVESGGVRIVSSGETVEAYVRGTDVEHRVRSAGDELRCTCPWYSKHQGKRGPCKHVLGVQISLETDEDA
jgi:hypothetical protein